MESAPAGIGYLLKNKKTLEEIMRKLTRNEVIELRSCKEMENGALEFFDRAIRMYGDDPETEKRLKDLKDMYLSVQDIPLMNGSAYNAYIKSMGMYYEYMDQMLADMGYTKHD